jgi:GNAT superfamily N-acetyltransferase
LQRALNELTLLFVSIVLPGGRVAVNERLEITSEREPSEEDVRVVRDGLLAFNVAHIGLDPQPGQVSLFLRDGDRQVVGGLLGGWRWRWLYVDKLWVDERYRGEGAGSRLLQRAESEALAAGCTDAVLDTFSFQARSFYERHGYTLYATLEGFPPGHRQFFFHKRLIIDPPTSLAS